jgi:glycerate 2-kinase
MNASHQPIKEQAVDIFRCALADVNPETAVRRALAELTGEIERCARVYVVGFGKAAVPMAEAARGVIGGRIAGGVVVTKRGHGGDLEGIPVIEAGHPIPNEAGADGARKIIDTVTGRLPEDLVLVLISGGGSALTTLGADGLTIDDLARTNRLLVESPADIHEINTVRKHLSAFSGGRLARHARPARVIALVLSDVVGDDLSAIASGPTAPDPTTFADAVAVLERYGLAEKVPAPVARHLVEGAAGRIAETPKPDDPVFAGVTNVIVGNAAMALSAARRRASDLGFSALVLSSSFSGDTHELSRFHAAVAREVLAYGRPASPPACLISGGETTLAVRGSGTGGRNTESALVFARETAGARGIFGLFCGSDGTDGPTDAAGAFTAPDTVWRAREKGLDAGRYLADNDSYTFFKALDDLIVTGPTRTNVMDIRLVFVIPEATR